MSRRRQTKPRYQGTTHELAGWAVSHLLTMLEAPEQLPTGDFLQRLVDLLRIFYEGTPAADAEQRLKALEAKTKELGNKVNVAAMGGKR